MRRRTVTTSRAVELLEGHLDQAERHIAAAIGAFTDETAAADLADRAGDPDASGTHLAHADTAMNEWSRALGARAALEAVYRDLTGRPSPTAAQTDSLLATFDLPANPVGLGDLPTTCTTATAAVR